MESPLISVVTGGTSGIGQAIAAGLVAAGHGVVLVARDERRAAAAVAGWKASGTIAVSDPQVVLADLRSPAQTRTAAARLLELVPRIDVLVHSAGIWPARLERTAEGLEASFAVNTMAPVILNRMLRPRLAATGARVVQVTAGLYPMARVDLQRTPCGDDFHPIRTYANTKLCNILTTLEAAAQPDAGAATFDLVHPGVVRTKLGDRSGPLGWLLRGVKLFWSSPATGAQAPLHLATAVDVAGARQGGSVCRYFDRLVERPLVGPATDRALGQALWRRTLELAEVD
jgi:NAD(P)-dependent dehydrogenase (short-subunit alcohol dehydrogenase family)